MASFNHNNRKCICCGEEYKLCFSCKEFADRKKYPTWMGIFHNENCRNLFNITGDLTNGTITEKEAKEKFAECDLSYKDKLHKNIVNAIDIVSGKSEKKTKKDMM